MKTELLNDQIALESAIGKLRQELHLCDEYERIIRDAYHDRFTDEELKRVLDPTTGFRQMMEADLEEMETHLDALTQPLSELLRGLREAVADDFVILYVLDCEGVWMIDQWIERCEIESINSETEIRLEKEIRSMAWVTKRVLTIHGREYVPIFWLGMNPIWNDGDRSELIRLLRDHPEIIYRAVPMWGEMGL